MSNVNIRKQTWESICKDFGADDEEMEILMRFYEENPNRVNDLASKFKNVVSFLGMASLIFIENVLCNDEEAH